MKNTTDFSKTPKHYQIIFLQSLDFPLITIIFVKTITFNNETYEKPFIPYHRNSIVHRMYAS